MRIKIVSYIKEKVVGNISPSTLLPPHSTRFLFGGICLLLFLSCSSIDCPMDNTVSTIYELYKSNGIADTLKDTLTVITYRHVPEEDPVALNRNVNTTSMSLPISYQGEEDVLYFVRSFPDSVKTIEKNEDGEEVERMVHFIGFITDTVTVTKTNRKHFESIDCTPSFFHTLTHVSYTTNGIDSIVISNPEVNYDQTKAHFHLYFKSRD